MVCAVSRNGSVYFGDCACSTLNSPKVASTLILPSWVSVCGGADGGGSDSPGSEAMAFRLAPKAR